MKLNAEMVEAQRSMANKRNSKLSSIKEESEQNKSLPLCIIHPDSGWKGNWDIFITGILIFTCITTPYSIALVTDEEMSWTIINYLIDGMFLIDILFIFNTAFYNDDYEMISDRGTIACQYLKSWFFIDIIAIIPFELAFQTNATDMVRLSRLGRIYKIVKLLKLMRLVKLSKGK